MQDRARAVRALYARREHETFGREWSGEEVMLGFVGDVGDLAKLIQSAEGVRVIPDAEARLAHELADCLWAVMTLADVYGVDLERAFSDTMDDLRARLD